HRLCRGHRRRDALAPRRRARGDRRGTARRARVVEVATDTDEQPPVEEHGLTGLALEAGRLHDRVVGHRAGGDGLDHEVDAVGHLSCELERDQRSSLAFNDVPSCHRAIVHSRSDSRLRYGTTDEPSVATRTPSRSARRTTARATSRWAETSHSPGTTNSVGGAKRAERSSMRASSATTISSVTSDCPAVSFVRLAGSVANSDMSTHRSRSMSINIASSSVPLPHAARATPSAACASSTDPYAVGAGASFATRPP